MPSPSPSVNSYRTQDMRTWENYRRDKSPGNRDALLKRFAPVIQSQVNKWAGPIPKDILLNKAKILALGAFDSYDAKKGASLATHVVNNLAPISRIVYTHQNTARLPENLTLRIHSLNTAKEHLTTMLGHTPTSDELHQELGWSMSEINRLDDYMGKDLIESVGGLRDDFYKGTGSDDDDLLAAMYFDLMPEEKLLFEMVTGYNGKKVMSNPEIMRELGITQAQLSYKKTLLTKKIERLSRGRR